MNKISYIKLLISEEGDYDGVEIKWIENYIDVHEKEFICGNFIKDWYKAIKFIYENNSKKPALIVYNKNIDYWLNRNPGIEIYHGILHKDYDDWEIGYKAINKILDYNVKYKNNFIFFYDKRTYSWKLLSDYCK